MTRLIILLLTPIACHSPKETGDPVETQECEVLDWYRDADGDGFGVTANSAGTCEAPAGYAARDGDCDDEDPAIHPEAEETCNQIDDNCDGTADDGVADAWYRDADLDGYGDPSTAQTTCVPPDGYILDGTDCDDTLPEVHPGAEEVCDSDDDDCDGRADAGVVGIWYSDADGDGYGWAYEAMKTCAPPPGWVANPTDCNPVDSEAYPDAVERCNGSDDDCDGSADEDWDQDGDGWQAPGCGDGDDCDDLRADVNPGMPEICSDTLDNDCDGIDLSCGIGGSYDLGTASAHLWAPTSGCDGGRLVEVDDVDGDGLGDILVATLYANSYGGAYITSGPLAASDSLDNAGYFLEGTRWSSGASRSMGIGSANGDAWADILLGTPYNRNGGARLVYGPVVANMILEDADVEFICDRMYCGHGSDLGDVTGDGLEDALIGSYNDFRAAGGIYIVEAPFDASIQVEDEAVGVLVGDQQSSYVGRLLRAGVDMNGDGIGDILAPAPYGTLGPQYSGLAYVVHGPVTESLDLASADGIWGGEATSDYAGIAVAQGDVNGDGLGDAIIGSNTSAGARTGGGVYIVFGPATGSASLASADLVILGTLAQSTFGSGLASGDVDGDGIDDILAGAPADSTAMRQAGATYLFYGPLSGTLTDTNADAAFWGKNTGDYSGQGLAIGDVNGDGWAEPVIGAPGDQSGGSGAGAVFMQEAGF